MSKADPDYMVLAEVFTAWWRDLQSLSKAGNPIMIGVAPKSPNRKALAELRRIGVAPEGGQDAVDVVRALECSAFQDLARRIKISSLRPEIRKWVEPDSARVEPFAIAASTIARVRVDESEGRERCGATAKMLGSPRSEGGKEPLFAEPRFKRLMRCRDDWPDLMAQARRIAAILEKRAPIGDLAASLVLWNADPRIRRDWAFQYYQKSFEAPEATPTADQTTTTSA
jgi:CRISPR type I-E-associated protein CasB/Cse2